MQCQNCGEREATREIDDARSQVCDDCYGTWRRAHQWSPFDAPGDVDDDADAGAGRRTF